MQFPDASGVPVHMLPARDASAFCSSRASRAGSQRERHHQSGFELAVPGHVECIATVADWASRWVGDEETSIKETALSLSGQANGGANDLERVRRGSVSVITEADPGQNRNK